MSKHDDIKPFPLRTVEIPVCRAPWVKYKNNPKCTEYSTMLLAQLHGEGTTEDGATVTYSAAGTTLRVSFEYEGDDKDAKHHQTYDIDIGSLAQVLWRFNKERREKQFADAPVEVR